MTLQWGHMSNGISNHQLFDCVQQLAEADDNEQIKATHYRPLYSEIPLTKASDVESVFVSWHHHTRSKPRMSQKEKLAPNNPWTDFI